MMFPIVSSEYIVKDPHLGAKGFWQEVDYPEMECTIAFPKAPYIINNEYPSLKPRSPHKGEHNMQVYSELIGLSSQELKSLEAKGIV